MLLLLFSIAAFYYSFFGLSVSKRFLYQYEPVDQLVTIFLFSRKSGSKPARHVQSTEQGFAASYDSTATMLSHASLFQLDPRQLEHLLSVA